MYIYIYIYIICINKYAFVIVSVCAYLCKDSLGP